jgi:hypothetical protein
MQDSMQLSKKTPDKAGAEGDAGRAGGMLGRRARKGHTQKRYMIDAS